MIRALRTVLRPPLVVLVTLAALLYFAISGVVAAVVEIGDEVATLAWAARRRWWR